MDENETIERAKSKQGILSKIQNFLTIGYGDKEDLRELDKQLRDLYYVDLRAIRHIWEEISLNILRKRTDIPNSDVKKVLQVLDRVTEKIHRADYGYAGLYDRKGHIREKDLARVLNYDKGLEEKITSLDNAVQITRRDVEGEKWGEVPVDLNNVKGLLSTLENMLNEREKMFRPLEM